MTRTEPIVKLLPAGFFRWHAMIVNSDGTVLTMLPVFLHRRAHRKAYEAAAIFFGECTCDPLTPVNVIGCEYCNRRQASEEYAANDAERPSTRNYTIRVTPGPKYLNCVALSDALRKAVGR